MLFSSACAPVKKPDASPAPDETPDAVITAAPAETQVPVPSPAPGREVKHTEPFDLDEFNARKKNYKDDFFARFQGSSGPIADIPVYYQDDILFNTYSMNYHLYSDMWSQAAYGVVVHPTCLYICMPDIKIRYLDSEHSYAMADTDTGYRLYIPMFSTGGSSYGIPYGWPLVIGEVHSHADFAAIRPGSTIDEVAAIDPVAGLYKTLILEHRENMMEHLAEHAQLYEKDPLTSLHYLSDGILKIEYELPLDGRLIVKNVLFSEDRILHSVNMGEADRPIVYSIDPYDLPRS